MSHKREILVPRPILTPAARRLHPAYSPAPGPRPNTVPLTTVLQASVSIAGVSSTSKTITKLKFSSGWPFGVIVALPCGLLFMDRVNFRERTLESCHPRFPLHVAYHSDSRRVEP